MEARSLVLNASFEPLGVISARRAVVLVLLGRADVVEAAAAQFRSELLALDVPIVVRLRTFVKVPFRRSVPLTRKALFSRDGFACAYCGTERGPFTWDHVLPRSRGGEHRWENVVTACSPCNAKKDDRTPDEAGMHLRVRPFAPSGALAIAVLVGRVDDAWIPYLRAA